MSLSLYPRWRNKMYLFIYLFLNNSCNAFLDGKHQATIQVNEVSAVIRMRDASNDASKGYYI